MARLDFKGKSIIRKMMVPMAAVILFQAALFSVVLLFGGTISQLNRNAADILNERVINRKNYLQNEMLQRWSNVDETVNTVQVLVANVLKENDADIRDVRVNTPLANQILEATGQSLVYMLRRNSVTGAFLILNSGSGYPQDGEPVQKSALYIRDLDPVSNPDNVSDLLLERAPASVMQSLGITLDSLWQQNMTFDASDPMEHYDYYYKPYQAAVDYPEFSTDDLGYWSRPFRLADTDIEVITYSVPLRSADGYVYGVLGIDLSTDYLRSLMPYSELDASKDGAYQLAIGHGDELVFDQVLSSGPAFRRLFGEPETTSYYPESSYNSCYKAILEEGKDDSYGCIQYFTLYNTNTPFEQDRWALIGILEERHLFGFSAHVRTTVLIAMAVSILIGLLGAVFAGASFTRPISALVRKVRASDPREPVELPPTHIAEIDELSSAIEHMGAEVAKNASKFSTILQVVGLPIGAFEYREGGKTVSYTRRFFEILRINAGGGEDGYMDVEAFGTLMKAIAGLVESRSEDGNERVLRLTEPNGSPRWVRLIIMESDQTTLGVVVDVTRETIERRKIEWERDYDILTNLYNRRAFHEQLRRKFQNPEKLKTAAMIMLDLDNLKYINDTYGHDYGDQYIRSAAAALKHYTPFNALLSRMSGDEFYIFIYGYSDKAPIRTLIRELKAGLQASTFPLPDNKQYRIRASAGVAWYPDDSVFYDELLRYADFAMYKVKNTVKGEFNEFDMESYNRDSYLLHSKEELNRLIDEQLVEYHFQPIVDAATGAIFGYEALMRSLLPSLKSPMEILTLARSQSKLYQIEKLTWYKAIDTFSKLDVPDDCFVFINSVANQILSEPDLQQLEQSYKDYLVRCIIELTEEEKPGEDCTSGKQEFAIRVGARLAIDDFGTGYNSDVLLLNVTPEFVKIDMSIVRNIDSDPNRRKILQNLVSYSRGRGIKVIAEGVETASEMETLILSGVDYLQGYYLGVPRQLPQTIPPEIVAAIVEIHNRIPPEKEEQP